MKRAMRYFLLWELSQIVIGAGIWWLTMGRATFAPVAAAWAPIGPQFVHLLSVFLAAR